MPAADEENSTPDTRFGGMTPGVGALMIGGMACFGSATPVSRVVGRSFPTWLGSMSRMMICVAVLAPIVVLLRRRRPSPESHRWHFSTSD